MNFRRAACAILLLVLAPYASAGAPSRRTLGELLENAVGSVPSGYSRVGHRDTGFTLAENRAAGEDGHETVMFTAEGGVYTKKISDASHLPRRLSELGSAQTYAQDTSASLNPNLACENCPTTDTRIRVTDTTEAPWDAIGLLARQDANAISAGISQCSGAIIGAQRQHVITAGHCLVDSSNGSGDNVDKITFYPSLNGQKLPFGTLSAVKARVLKQYVQERSTTPLALNFDFALITLSSAAPKGTSYLDIEAGTGRETFDLTTAGYPADKNQQSANGQFMYKVDCPNVNFDFTNGNEALACGDRCSNMVVHDCLSYEGQSGSAIWSTDGQNRTVRAILTGALQESDGTTYNVGTQLNSFVYNTIVSWYNEDVTQGLSLAPPAPPNATNGRDRITSTLGSRSWWHRNWWYVVLPVAVCLVLGALCMLCTCCRRVQKRKSRPMVGATYPPAHGGAPPQQQYQPQPPSPQNGNGFPTQAYYGQQNIMPGASQSAAPTGNFAKYGPSYYNGTGTNGTNGFHEGYPSR